MESHALAEARQEARKILLDLARSIDRRLDVEVRDVPGQERLHVTLTHGQKHSHTELALQAVLTAPADAVSKHELKLKLKRVADTMLFRPMPNHRISVKAVPPPGGQQTPRGFGRGRR
ncbi:MAG: hypothetical protein ACREQL_06030 [Candidatus Binatia bacterium]